MAPKRKNKSKNLDGFIFLPRWFFETSILSSREKFFCLVLAYHRNTQNKQCNPGVPLISLEAGLCERTIKTYRRKLAKLGAIDYKPGTDKKNRAKYKLNWLDGSGEEIMMLKKLFTSHQLVQRNSRLTSAKEHLVTSAKEHLVTSAKERVELVLTKLERKEQQHQNKKRKSAVVPFCPQKGKPKSQNPPQELINRITRFFNDTGWKEWKEKDIVTQINLVFEFEKARLSDYFRYWEKAIDNKKRVRNKPGLLITMIKQRNYPPGFFDDEEDLDKMPDLNEITPPYLQKFEDNVVA